MDYCINVILCYRILNYAGIIVHCKVINDFVNDSKSFFFFFLAHIGIELGGNGVLYSSLRKCKVFAPSKNLPLSSLECKMNMTNNYQTSRG